MYNEKTNKCIEAPKAPITKPPINHLKNLPLAAKMALVHYKHSSHTNDDLLNTNKIVLFYVKQ